MLMVRIRKDGICSWLCLSTGGYIYIIYIYIYYIPIFLADLSALQGGCLTSPFLFAVEREQFQLRGVSTMWKISLQDGVVGFHMVS